MTRRVSLGSGAIAGLAVLALLASVFAGGAAAADTTVINQTVAVDDSTQSVYVEATNTTQNLSVELLGVHNDTETSLTNHTIASTSSTLWTYDAANIDTTQYESVRVLVTAPNATATNATVEAGTIDKVAAGGGGGWLGGSSGIGGASVLGLVVLVMAGGFAFLVFRED